MTPCLIHLRTRLPRPAWNTNTRSQSKELEAEPCALCAQQHGRAVGNAPPCARACSAQPLALPPERVPHTVPSNAGANSALTGAAARQNVHWRRLTECPQSFCDYDAGTGMAAAPRPSRGARATIGTEGCRRREDAHRVSEFARVALRALAALFHKLAQRSQAARAYVPRWPARSSIIVNNSSLLPAPPSPHPPFPLQPSRSSAF